jgi:alcohol dehydrogenase class IV
MLIAPPTPCTTVNFSATPQLILRPGALDMVGTLVRRYGRRVVLITGESSLRGTNHWTRLHQSLDKEGIRAESFTVAQEPTPELVDSLAAKARSLQAEAVISIGGGSVMDCAKAVGAMATIEAPATSFLEGIGTSHHPGTTLPHLALPTTAGTGSEATKNAVLSRIGPLGFKSSLRHDNFIPTIALIDPLLQLSCPPRVSASTGMDALTQLIESYLSTAAHPLSDALALSGIQAVGSSLLAIATTEGDSVELRTAMAYGAYLSGVTLANVGLGVVHGLASPLGCLVEIPHGVVCGTLLAEATRHNISALNNDSEHDQSQAMLKKYAFVGQLLGGVTCRDVQEGCEQLLTVLTSWTELLGMARLREYGITREQLDRVAEGKVLKNNPVNLDKNSILEILNSRL